MSEGTKREKGEGTAGAKNAPLGVEGVRQSGVEPPHSKKATGARRQFRAIKGTRDILPPDTALWNWFEKTAREVMESYNFAEIRTPIFEETELFARAVGEETDVVNKEMYSVEDPELAAIRTVRDKLRGRGRYGGLHRPEIFMLGTNALAGLLKVATEEGDLDPTPSLNAALETLLGAAENFDTKTFQLVRPLEGPEWEVFRSRVQYAVGQLDAIGSSMTLRPEATASVCRAYIEHGMQTRPGDQKLYYVGPMFRRERPQKGRYRQFYQIGAEVLGTSDAPAIDAELIEMLTVLIERCGIEKWTLLVNSIGCPDTPAQAGEPERKGCRPKYVELLRGELRKPEIFSKLGPDSQRRVETNPLRVMDSKLPEEQAIIEKLPKISEHLCAECREHYEKLKKELALRKVAFTEAPRLVRGLDYYMRTTFEITSPVLGAQNALCGGGRYDGLVEMLSGPKGIKGIGFALGEDRFIDAIVETKKIDATRAVDVFVAWMGEKAYPTAVRLARVLREAGRAVELPPEEMKFRKAFERADKIGARYVLILGEDEIASGQLTVKRMEDGKQEKVGEGELLKAVTDDK